MPADASWRTDLRDAMASLRIGDAERARGELEKAFEKLGLDERGEPKRETRLPVIGEHWRPRDPADMRGAWRAVVVGSPGDASRGVAATDVHVIYAPADGALIDHPDLYARLPNGPAPGATYRTPLETFMRNWRRRA